MIKIKQATKKGYIECIGGGIADISYPKSKTRRGRVQMNGYICPTITTQGELVRMKSEYEIYSLTPRECWRLMDFNEGAYDKAAEVTEKKTQLYKQAGNSIVVNVLVAILGQMFEGKEEVYKNEYIRKDGTEGRQGTDESGTV